MDFFVRFFISIHLCGEYAGKKGSTMAAAFMPEYDVKSEKTIAVSIYQ